MNRERNSVRKSEQSLCDALTKVRDLGEAIETKSIEIEALCEEQQRKGHGCDW
jgi:hypothetical protein